MGFIEISVLILSFLILLAIGVPVAWTLGISSVLTILFTLNSTTAFVTMAQQILTSLDSFTLLAIPFFILAGQLMNKGGIASRLINFAKNIVGSLPGGLAHINVVAAMLFGAVAGSSVAAASAIGSILGPRMEKEGYTKEFGAAINISSSTMGLIIPPSNILIVYSLASGGTSIAALFISGYIPGILTGLILMGVAAIWAIRKNFPVGERSSVIALFKSFVEALPSLLLLIIVIGGIIAGIFTATEAAAIAVVYTLGLAFFYKEITLKSMPDVLMGAIQTTSIVMLLIATSISMSWVMSFGHLPQTISEALLSISDNAIILILIINMILLFVGVSVAGTTIEKVIKPLLPLFIAMLITLLLVTFWEDLSLALPRLFDLI